MGMHMSSARHEEEALRRTNQELHGFLLQSDVARSEVLEAQNQFRTSKAEVLDLRMKIGSLEEHISMLRNEAVAAEFNSSSIRAEAAELCAQAAEQAVGMRKEVSDKE